jgi:polyhydroxyalkanoate synthesis repressor PhaR
MSEVRIIKKYPNRRLYDTVISSYITLEDVKKLVLENTTIQVLDARSKEDITHSTLLQIIIEQEGNGPAMFSSECLQQMIRLYGGATQGVLSQMFEQALNFFKAQQQIFKEGKAPGMKELFTKDPFSRMSELAEQNISSWQELQEQWTKNLALMQTKPSSTTATETHTTQETAEPLSSVLENSH